MAADNISNIIDVSGFDADLGKVITGISTLEAKMEEANSNAIQVIIDSKSLDTLNRLTSATEAQTKAQQDLNGVNVDNTNIMQQANQVTVKMGASATDTAISLGAMKTQMQNNINSLAAMNRLQAENGALTDAQKDRVAFLTANIEKLKASIATSTASLGKMNSSVKEVTVSTGQASSAITVLGVNVENTFARMAVRMVAMQLVFVPLIAGIAAFTTYLLSSKKAAEDYAKSLKDVDEAIMGSALGGQQKASQLIAIATDTAQAMHLRIDAVKDLQELYPNYFANLSQEAILTGNIKKEVEELNQALFDKAVMEANYDKAKLAAKKYSDIYDDMLKVQYAIDKIGEKSASGGVVSAQEGQRLLALQKNLDGIKDKLAAAKGEVDKYDQIGDEFAKKAAKVIVEDPKEKKKKVKEPANEMQAALAAEKANYERRLEENKAFFESTKQTYADEQKLNDDNIKAANDYGQHSFEILNYWLQQKKANYQTYLKDSQNVNKDLLAADVKYSVDEKKILDKILADREDAQKQLAKLLEQELELNEQKQQMEDAQKEGADHTKYAKSFAPFIDGITGGSSDFGDKMKGFDTQIKQKKEELKDAQLKLKNAKEDGNESDISKFGGSDGKGGEVGQKTTDLAKIEADKQKSYDDQIIQKKEELAEKTIELAQQTFAALKTINDNEIAQQQMNLEIKSRTIQLAYQEQVDAVNASAGYQITKENELAKMAAQKAAQQNAIQQQQNQLALKKAKGDKAAAEAGIVANTALAIMKTIAGFADLLPEYAPLLAATIAAEVAIGGVQLAAAASAPLPQFWKGGTTETPYFIAGERGVELMTTPGGKTMLADKPGIYSAPLGTKINTADETAAFMRYAQNSMSMSINSRGELKEHAPSMTDKRIVEKLDEVIESNYQVAMMQRTIKNNITVTVKDRLQIY